MDDSALRQGRQYAVDHPIRHTPIEFAPMDVLVIHDDICFRQSVAERLQYLGHEVFVAESPKAGWDLAKKRSFPVVLMDLSGGENESRPLILTLKHNDPKCQIVLMAVQDSDPPASVAIRRDAFQILSQQCSLSTVEAAIEKAYAHHLTEKENVRLRQLLQQRMPPAKIIGATPGIQRLLEQINQAAQSDDPVLIFGEKGTEKELVCRVLHQTSRRSHGAMVFVGCNIRPESLRETELFGSQAGGLPMGGPTQLGVLELADGGMIFIEELSKLDLSLQKKLVDSIKAGTVRPLGSIDERKFDTRVIASTLRDIDREIREIRFLPELVSLFGWRIVIPPLRERIDDIPLWIDHFLRQQSDPWRITEEARTILCQYNWPGNVSELQNVLERAMMIAKDETIRLDELATTVVVAGRRLDNLADNERRHVERVLKREGYHRQRTARALGINRRSLYRLIERYNIPIPEKGTDTE